MQFTDISVIDPILSILVALFILVNAFKNFKAIIDLFLEKTPKNIKIAEITKHLLTINGVEDVHHIHVWSIDGFNHCATMHVVTKKETAKIKHLIKEELMAHGIGHTTVEFENPDEKCVDAKCEIHPIKSSHHHH